MKLTFLLNIDMAKKKEESSVSDEGSYGFYDEEDDGSVEDLAGRIRNDSADEAPSHHDEESEAPS